MADDDWGGPYLQVAALCEQVIEGKDGVLSLIRLVDRVQQMAVGPELPEKMPATPVNLKLVLTFKSGFARGQQAVRVKPVGPSHQAMPEVSLPILFEGEDRGQSLILSLNMQVEESGLYWFEVFLGERLVTRVPLRVLYQKLQLGH